MPVFPTASTSHQEAYTNLLASSIRRQTEEARRTTIPQRLNQNHHEKADSYVPDEGTKQKAQKNNNEVEIGNLPEKEFRIMTVNIIQDLGKRMEAKTEKMRTVYTKDL